MFLLDKCLSKKDEYNILLITNKNATSAERIEFLCDTCDSNGIEYFKHTRNNITINGNKFYSIASHKDILYSIPRGKKLIVVYDEYVFIPDIHLQKIEDSLRVHNVYLNITTSTPNGCNRFKELYDSCENTFTVNWKDIPGRISNWKSQQTQMIGSDAFESEYNNKFIMKK